MYHKLENIFERAHTRTRGIGGNIDDSKVLYASRGKDESPEQVQLGSQSMFYIGQTYADGKGLYTEEFLKGMLRTLAKHTPAGKPIQIKVLPLLHQTVNQENGMSPREEIAYVDSLAESTIGKRYNDVSLINLESEKGHHDLSTILRLEGVEELLIDDDKELPTLTYNSLTSLDLAIHLCWVMKQNKNFYQRCAGLVNKKNKERLDDDVNGYHAYYAPLEVAIRLYDYLKGGIVWQGGAPLQYKYDNIIQEILQGKNVYTGMEPLVDFVRGIAKEYNLPEFKPYRFDLEEYKKVEEQVIHVKQKKSKLLAIGIFTTLALLAVFTTKIVNKVEKKRQHEKIEQNVDKALVDLLKDQELSVLFKFHGEPIENDSLKMATIKNWSHTLAEMVRYHYGKGNKSIEELRLLILSDFAKQKELRYDLELDLHFFRDYMQQEFVPNHPVELANLGMSSKPYERLVPYQKNFQNSRSQTIEKKLDAHTHIGENGLGTDSSPFPHVDGKLLGKYQTANGMLYDLMVNYQDSMIYARRGRENNINSEPRERSTKLGSEVAKDLFDIYNHDTVRKVCGRAWEITSDYGNISGAIYYVQGLVYETMMANSDMRFKTSLWTDQQVEEFILNDFLPINEENLNDFGIKVELK